MPGPAGPDREVTVAEAGHRAGERGDGTGEPAGQQERAQRRQGDDADAEHGHRPPRLPRPARRSSDSGRDARMTAITRSLLVTGTATTIEPR